MFQKDKPYDYVIATGKNYSVRKFLEKAFEEAGVPVESNGRKGVEEEYVRKDNGKTVVKIDPKYFRPAEVETLLGDPSKAKEKLGWKPKVLFDDLVREMIKSDKGQLDQELYGCRGNGEK